MRSLIRELFETIILALLIFLALQFSLRNYVVEGSSMHPTLEDGEFVLVNKLVYSRVNPHEIAELIPFFDVDNNGSLFPFHPPRRGEMIIFRFCTKNQEQTPGCPNDSPELPSRDFVKRVVAVGGDRLDVVNNRLRVNGEEMTDAVVQKPELKNIPDIVPTNSFFVLGDNRRASNDSRRWGPVPAENVIGKAWFTFWPLNRWRPLPAAPF